MGKQIFLNCLATANPIANYRWFYKSNTIRQFNQINQLAVHQMTHQLMDYTSDRDQLIELNMAQHWKYQMISRTGILIIKNLTELDSGQYVCVSNNSYGQDQLELKLTVKQKLVIQLTNNNQSPSLNKQSVNSLHLKCNVLSGFPIQRIQWFHNGQSLNQSLFEDNDLILTNTATNSASSTSLFSSMINKQNLIHNSHSKHRIVDNGQQLIINKFESSDCK